MTAMIAVRRLPSRGSGPATARYGWGGIAVSLLRMSLRDDFYERTKPTLGVAPVPRNPPELPVLVLVVDDADDDELVAIMAEVDEVPASGFRGDWGNVLESSPDGPVTFKFRLRRDDGSERAWTYEGPPKEMVDLIASGNHDVAILPRELAGNLSDFNPLALAGALIVEVEMSDDACEMLRFKSGYY